MANSDCQQPGSYSIPGIPAGTYRLEFSDEDGSCLTQWYVQGQPGGAASADDGSDVVVTDGQDTNGIDATLQFPTGGISGAITVPADYPQGDDLQVDVYQCGGRSAKSTVGRNQGWQRRCDGGAKAARGAGWYS